MREIQHFIDGAFVGSSDGRTFPSVSPIDNTEIATVAEGGAAEVDAAVAAARKSFGSWSRTTAGERRAILERIADGIMERGEELAEWECRDMGKPIADARALDIPRSAQVFRFFAEWNEHSATEAYAKPNEGLLTYSLREPLGVIAAISPWNFPLMTFTWKVAPALAFGCTVVAKPAEQSPVTATILAEICHEAGVPPGVFNLVHGFGPDSVGEALTTHPDVDGVTFTGETATGRAIMAAGAPTLKRLSLELGGKSANIVCADADLDAAVMGSLAGAFVNQGQVCVAGSRLLVQREIYDEFTSRFVEAAEAWQVGNPLEASTRMGPVVSSEHLERVLGYIELAQQEGATLLTGGHRLTDGDLGSGNYVAPTVFADASNDMRCVREEIFGPVQVIVPFDTLDEAIAIANDSDYGLAGMLWTRDLGTVQRVTNEVRTGTLWVNTFFTRDLRAPFGGYKDSGLGREGGDHSFDFFTESKSVVMKSS